MKELLLIRHAKSSWDDISLPDKKRPLNPRGHRDAPYMAEFCRKHGIILTHLISSPAKRAYSTAKYFHKEFKDSSNLEKESELYFGSESDWLYLINDLDSDVKFPAFFSHNPTITYFSNLFSDEDIENVPTCGIIHLESEAENWKDLHYTNTVVKQLFFPKIVRSKNA